MSNYTKYKKKTRKNMEKNYKLKLKFKNKYKKKNIFKLQIDSQTIVKQRGRQIDRQPAR